MIIPAFELQDHLGRTWLKADLLGHWTVLFWYPKANGSVCNIQARGYGLRLEDFSECNAQVLGASSDYPGTNADFAECEGLEFPLLSDPQQVLAEALGATREADDPYLGRSRRLTFIIDPEGQIRDRWSVEQAGLDADRALGRLGEFKAWADHQTR